MPRIHKPNAGNHQTAVRRNHRLPIAAAVEPATFFPLPTPGGVVNWYDFTDRSSLWKDTARTSPVTADADAVLSVTDKSGTGNHLSQATNGPGWKVGIRNGRNVLRFDGTNDELSGTVGADTSQTITVALAKSTAAGVSSKTAWAYGNSAQFYTNTGDAVAAGGTAQNWLWFGNQASGVVALGGTCTSWNIFSIVVNSAASVTPYLNGTALTGFDPNDTVTTVTTATLGRTASGNFCDVDLGQFIVHNSALSVTDVQALHRYLGSLFAVTVA